MVRARSLFHPGLMMRVEIEIGVAEFWRAKHAVKVFVCGGRKCVGANLQLNRVHNLRPTRVNPPVCRFLIFVVEECAFLYGPYI